MARRDGVAVSAARLMLSSRWSALQPIWAASVRHRVVRSAAPLPDLRARVSAEASRVRAARSHRDGGRPSRWRKSVDLVGERSVDRHGPLGEDVEELVGDAGDLGLAVADRQPVDAEAVGELVAQHGLVEAAEHALVPLEVAGVERQPAAFRRVDLGGDDRVGVDLRIVGTRRGLAECGDRQPVGVGMHPPAVGADAGRRAEPLEVRQGCGDGDVVGLQQPRVAGECPPHRQRLGCRERRVEPGDGTDDPAVGGDPVEQLTTELHSR